MSPVARSTPGMLSNALPVRLAVLPDMTVAQLAGDTTRLMRQVFRHQRYDIANLRRDIGRIGAEHRVFGPTVNFMPFDYDLRFGGSSRPPLTISPMVRSRISRSFCTTDPTIVSFVSTSIAIRLCTAGTSWPACSSGSSGSVRRVLTRAPDRQPGDPCLATSGVAPGRMERDAAGGAGGDAGVAVCGSRSLRTPDAVAVVCGDIRLSYRELDVASNRLAHHLRGLGVGPEVVVGLCVERSAEMLVGLLGILKAGGAYLPLDPDYPSERLAFMLSDARAPVLVTQAALADRLADAASSARRGVPRRRRGRRSRRSRRRRRTSRSILATAPT